MPFPLALSVRQGFAFTGMCSSFPKSLTTFREPCPPVRQGFTLTGICSFSQKIFDFSGALYRNGLRSAPIFVCTKISHPLRRSSFSQKVFDFSGALFSLAKFALILLFREKSHDFSRVCAYGAFISRFLYRKHGCALQAAAASERTSLCSDFCSRKNQSPAASFLLFRKKARCATTFLRVCACGAFYTQIFNCVVSVYGVGGGFPYAPIHRNSCHQNKRVDVHTTL